MSYYLVTAKPLNDLQPLKLELDRGEIKVMRPFGPALDHSLNNARRAEGGWVTWEEEDYCSPPLAQERAAVLDRYFVELSVVKVTRDEGWKQIDHLSKLW